MAASLDEYRIDYDCVAGVTFDAVELRLRSAHNRQIDAELEAGVAAEWEAKLQTHPRMFNGRKFRYGRATAAGSGARLEMGLTDYRSMVGTNLSPQYSEILARGPRLLANAMGNGAVVETSDGCVMLLLRSPTMLEAPNTYVFPGGHPEPKGVGLHGWGDTELAEHELAAEAGEAAAAEVAVQVERRARDELFDSMRREVVEELGVSADQLCPAGARPQVFIGVTERLANSRYTMAFVMSCASSSSEIMDRYKAGHAEDSFESTRLLAVPIAELAGRAAAIPMPGCHRGVLELYLRHLAARGAAGA